MTSAVFFAETLFKVLFTTRTIGGPSLSDVSAGTRLQACFNFGLVG
jgi:hypothetical protein